MARWIMKTCTHFFPCGFMMMLTLFATKASAGGCCWQRGFLGVANDCYISASSWHPHCPLTQIRLNSQSAWCSGKLTPDQWVKVDLLHPVLVTSVKTMIRKDYLQYVKSYVLEYSSDGWTWTTYKKNGYNKVVTGLSSRQTSSKVELKPPFVARYIRITPKTWYGRASMRLEVYGCKLQEIM